MGGGAVTEEFQLLFFETVLHLASWTILLSVEQAGRNQLCWEGGDDKAEVLLPSGPQSTLPTTRRNRLQESRVL